MSTGTEERDGLLRRLRAAVATELGGIAGRGPFALVDFPDHANVGDSAIWLGTTAFFRARGAEPAYVASVRTFSEPALRAALPEGPILIHGGGNFGDLWPRHQEFRERLLERFRGQDIVQLPQSIHYDDPRRLVRTARAIARHGRFLLLVRDRPSLEFARAHFDCPVRLCPDPALCLGPLERTGVPTADVLCLLRTDRERVTAAPPAFPGLRVRVADWLSEGRLGVRAREAAALGAAARRGMIDRGAMRRARYEAAARARVARGCRLLSSGRVVVTDRLHAHLLSLLLGIPHAILDNSYGKLGRFMEAWTAGASGSYRAGSPDEALEWAASALELARPRGAEVAG